VHRVRPVDDDQWDIVAWLWQDFRHDMASIVNGFPYADGRYRHEWLDEYPGPGRVGYLAWAPHPNTGELAPVAFALVKGLDTERHALASFFVVPAARRGGLGTLVALEVLGRHPGAWEIAFQEDNHAAGRFWRLVADQALGDWTEEAVPVPDRPDVPPDHWIRGDSLGA
jgi:predicted acetyltransferase